MAESQPKKLEQQEQPTQPKIFVYIINPTTNMENDTFRICFLNGVLYWKHKTDYIGFHDGFQTRSTTGVNYHFQGSDEIYQVEYLRGDTHSNVFKFHKKTNESIEGFHKLDLKAEQDTISLTSEISTLNLKRTVSRI
ncbi:hypothetical protein ACTFIW_004036 [Dictyostelium discoideum]